MFDATLVTGDSFKTKISGTNDPKFREGFEEMYDVGKLPMPFYAVLGAHDYEYEAVKAQLEYGRAHPESRWKMSARWYRLDLPTANPQVTILMLDSTKVTSGKPNGRHRRSGWRKNWPSPVRLRGPYVSRIIRFSVMGGMAMTRACRPLGVNY